MDEPLLGGGDISSTASFQQMDENEDGEAGVDTDADELVHLDKPAPPGRDGRVIRLVNQILLQALNAGASDIHLEPPPSPWAAVAVP